MYVPIVINCVHVDISTHKISDFGCFLQIIVDKASQTWTLYDAGPRHVRSPLVCLPPVCGTADVFFRQLLDLTAVGYRVISVRYYDTQHSGLCTDIIETCKFSPNSAPLPYTLAKITISVLLYPSLGLLHIHIPCTE